MTRTSRRRSRVSVCTTRSCWKSFCPKYATSGRTIAKSLVTTVATPAKCPGRAAPSSRAATGPGWTRVASPGGYISSAPGAKAAVTPSRAQRARSAGSSRGYAARSSPGPNCVGLTKMETTLAALSRTARSTSEAWPPCSAPMVGTRPIPVPAPARNARASATVRRTFTRDAISASPADSRVAKPPSTCTKETGTLSTCRRGPSRSAAARRP